MRSMLMLLRESSYLENGVHKAKVASVDKSAGHQGLGAG